MSKMRPCDFFLGADRKAGCERCGAIWLKHYGVLRPYEVRDLVPDMIPMRGHLSPRPMTTTEEDDRYLAFLLTWFAVRPPCESSSDDDLVRAGWLLNREDRDELREARAYIGDVERMITEGCAHDAEAHALLAFLRETVGELDAHLEHIRLLLAGGGLLGGGGERGN